MFKNNLKQTISVFFLLRALQYTPGLKILSGLSIVMYDFQDGVCLSVAKT